MIKMPIWLQKIKRGWKSVWAPLLTGLVGVEFQKPWLIAGMTLPGLESSHRKLLTQVLCFSRSRAGATKPGNKKALEHWDSCGFHCSTAGSGVLGCHGSEGRLCNTRAISKLLLSRTSRRQLENAPVESSTSLGSASTHLNSLSTQVDRPQTEPVTKARQGHKSVWPDSLRKSSKVASVTRGAANLTSQQQCRAQPCSSQQDLLTPTMNCAWTD